MLCLLVAAMLDALRLQGGERVKWICIIAFLFPIGPIVYILDNPINNNNLLKYRPLIAVLAVIAFVSLADIMYALFSL